MSGPFSIGGIIGAIVGAMLTIGLVNAGTEDVSHAYANVGDVVRNRHERAGSNVWVHGHQRRDR
jgi:hypothetical protein